MASSKVAAPSKDVILYEMLKDLPDTARKFLTLLRPLDIPVCPRSRLRLGIFV